MCRGLPQYALNILTYGIPTYALILPVGSFPFQPAHIVVFLSVIYV